MDACLVGSSKERGEAKNRTMEKSPSRDSCKRRRRRATPHYVLNVLSSCRQRGWGVVVVVVVVWKSGTRRIMSLLCLKLKPGGRGGAA